MPGANIWDFLSDILFYFILFYFILFFKLQFKSNFCFLGDILYYLIF